MFRVVREPSSQSEGRLLGRGLLLTLMEPMLSSAPPDRHHPAARGTAPEHVCLSGGGHDPQGGCLPAGGRPGGVLGPVSEGQQGNREVGFEIPHLP